MRLALVVLAACSSPVAREPRVATPTLPPVPADEPPGPRMQLVGFDGPFGTLAGLCKRELQLAAEANVPDEPPACVTDEPSFQEPAPGLAQGRDRISGKPYRTVAVVPIVVHPGEHEEVLRCLLVIETARGWFASERLVDTCRPGATGAFRAVGGFEVRDLFGDARPELLVERGESHAGACHNCPRRGHIARFVCGLDHEDRPHCTAPVEIVAVSEERRERSWSVRRTHSARAGALLVGPWPVWDPGAASSPAAPTYWVIDFD